MMTVQEFIDKYDAGQASSKESIITTEYVNFEDKMADARTIVDLTMYKEINGQKVFWRDTPLQYHVFLRRMIERYTDIQFSQDVVREYNQLNERGLIQTIISLIPVQEYQEFDTIVKMTVNDEIANTRDFAAVVDRGFETIKLMLDAVLENPKMQEAIADNIVQFTQPEVSK